jgi:hypothetical protein
MHHESRPCCFLIGGHKLDFAKVGIAGEVDLSGVMVYPAGYTPWATPQLYDTTEPGRSSAGHEREFRGLTEDEKQALLEYLKVL